MINIPHFAPRIGPKIGLAALMAATMLSGTMLSGTAQAGQQTRAEAAIAEAKGKIDAGDKVGVGDQAPELQAQARQTLMSAEDLLSHHNKQEALTTAHHASELADQALVTANTRKADAEHARRDALRDAAANAQQSAVNANMRADSAQQATTLANGRASSAEQSAAMANAQADAMRNAPPPAPTTTTVDVTQHETDRSRVATTHHVRHRVAHRHGHAAHTTTTTTQITTSHP